MSKYHHYHYYSHYSQCLFEDDDNNDGVEVVVRAVVIALFCCLPRPCPCCQWACFVDDESFNRTTPMTMPPRQCGAMMRTKYDVFFVLVLSHVALIVRMVMVSSLLIVVVQI